MSSKLNHDKYRSSRNGKQRPPSITPARDAALEKYWTVRAVTDLDGRKLMAKKVGQQLKSYLQEFPPKMRRCIRKLYLLEKLIKEVQNAKFSMRDEYQKKEIIIKIRDLNE